ncbi:hypothetical protein BAU15_01160 [Enterococcus sp. JM4C]|uniref:hypothetical protein n=1 Tax=Candidatus Enterococcus huntleyi TaxID=1857217 RepID=UPI001379DAB3|nr:hypothetical protein [Enterococcus sp. JM4C]KAF1299283.1 hypothetical protein BAU15_01160 [Enterococcus sp. JM4C]
MKKIKRDTIILLSTFWCVGLGIIFFRSMNQIIRQVPENLLMILMIVMLIALLVSVVVLFKYICEGWMEFKQTKQANFWQFLWTDDSIIEEDERSIKISEHALKKSNEYTEGITALFLLGLIISGVGSVTTSQIIFALLILFTVKTLSYYFLSKKGYYA